MKQLFLLTKMWNHLMGNGTPSSFKFPTNEERILMRDLAQEEANEMFEAESKHELLDSLADQQFVLWGNVAMHGITWDEFQDYCDKVVKSNNSKFANTEEEAIASVKKEADRLGISEEKVAYLQLEGRYVIYNKESGKILKSINYRPPEEM